MALGVIAAAGNVLAYGAAGRVGEAARTVLQVVIAAVSVYVLLTKAILLRASGCVGRAAVCHIEALQCDISRHPGTPPQPRRRLRRRARP